MPVRPTVRATALALVGLLSVPLSMAATTVGAAAAPAPCKVVEQGKTGSRSNLQAAIDAAQPGATLIVTGTCSGSYTVDQNLTLKKGATAATIKGSGGRALHVTGGRLTVIGVRLTGSAATDCPAYGGYLCGAVLLNDSKTILDRVTVSGSVVDGGATLSVYGGALFNSAGATMTIKRSTITDNKVITGASQQADAAVANEGTMSILRSRVADNTSTGETAYGGALYTYGHTSSLTIVDSTFTGNVAEATGFAEGGAIENDQGVITIRRSLFSGNRAESPSSAGGALVLYADEKTITDSTFTGNTAERGAGIAVMAAGAVTVTGSTIARNKGVTGGGLFLVDGSSLTLGATIVAGNTATTASPDCSASAVTSAGHNLIGKGDDCTGLTNAVDGDKVGSAAAPINPRLGTLAANGGPTKTLALLKGSPAINAAGAAPCATAKDQRGVKRPQGGKCDIGAFEKS